MLGDKHRQRILLFLILAIFISAVSIIRLNIFADSTSMVISYTTDKTQYSPGDEVWVTVTASNFNDGQGGGIAPLGIVSSQINVNFDSNVFDSIGYTTTASSGAEYKTGNYIGGPIFTSDTKNYSIFGPFAYNDGNGRQSVRFIDSNDNGNKPITTDPFELIKFKLKISSTGVIDGNYKLSFDNGGLLQIYKKTLSDPVLINNSNISFDTPEIKIITKETLTTPQPPANVAVAVKSDGNVDVTFDASPSAGGVAIDHYNVYAYKNGNDTPEATVYTGSTTPVAITGLDTQASYRFRVTAVSTGITGQVAPQESAKSELTSALTPVVDKRIRVTLVTDKQSYKPGDEMKVTVRVSNTHYMAPNGLFSIKLAVKYDPAVFNTSEYTYQSEGNMYYNPNAAGAYSVGPNAVASIQFSDPLDTSPGINDDMREIRFYEYEGNNGDASFVDSKGEPLDEFDFVSFKIRVKSGISASSLPLSTSLVFDTIVPDPSTGPRSQFLCPNSDTIIDNANVSYVSKTVDIGSSAGPAAPTHVKAGVTVDGKIDISFDTQNDIRNYTVYVYKVVNGLNRLEKMVDSTASAITVDGLDINSEYVFGVTATDTSNSTSAMSVLTEKITPKVSDVPDAPGDVIASIAGMGDGQVKVSFKKPVRTGGSPIDHYTVMSNGTSMSAVVINESDFSGTDTVTKVISGLKLGASYTFYVTATNANGKTSRSSMDSNMVTLMSSSTMTAYVTTDKTSYKPGDTVQVTVGLNNIPQAMYGRIVAALLGVKYDNTVFGPPAGSTVNSSYLSSYYDPFNSKYNTEASLLKTKFSLDIPPYNYTGPDVEAGMSEIRILCNDKSMSNTPNVFPESGLQIVRFALKVSNEAQIGNYYDLSIDSNYSSFTYLDSNDGAYDLDKTGITFGSQRIKIDMITDDEVVCPGPTQNVKAEAGDKEITVSFEAPEYDGGRKIVEYEVTAASGNDVHTVQSMYDSQADNGPDTTVKITGLQNDVEYTITVTAKNAKGLVGPPQKDPCKATPKFTTIPDPPAIKEVLGGNGQATMVFEAPAYDGLSSITGYKVTSYVVINGVVDTTTGVSSTTSEVSLKRIAIRNLTNGTSYKFTVQAINKNGCSLPSGYSSPVTPSDGTKMKVVVTTDKDTYNTGDEVSVAVSLKDTSNVSAEGLYSVKLGVKYDYLVFRNDSYVDANNEYIDNANGYFTRGPMVDNGHYYDFSSPIAVNSVDINKKKVNFLVFDNKVGASPLPSCDFEIIKFKLKVDDNAGTGDYTLGIDTGAGLAQLFTALDSHGNSIQIDASNIIFEAKTIHINGKVVTKPAAPIITVKAGDRIIKVDITSGQGGSAPVKYIVKAVPVDAGYAIPDAVEVITNEATITAGLVNGEKYNVSAVAMDVDNNMSDESNAVLADVRDHSSASAALAVAGGKAQGSSFGISITGAKDMFGDALTGSVTVTITSDKVEGQVFSGIADFSNTPGAATVTIAAGKVVTLGDQTLTVAVTGVTPQPTVAVKVVAATMPKIIATTTKTSSGNVVLVDQTNCIIYGLVVKTTVAKLLTYITGENGDTITVLRADDTPVANNSTTYVGSGNKVIATLNGVSKTYYVVLFGDVSGSTPSSGGDGLVNASDCSKVISASIGNTALITNIYCKAAANVKCSAVTILPNSSDVSKIKNLSIGITSGASAINQTNKPVIK